MTLLRVHNSEDRSENLILVFHHDLTNLGNDDLFGKGLVLPLIGGVRFDLHDLFQFQGGLDEKLHQALALKHGFDILFFL